MTQLRCCCSVYLCCGLLLCCLIFCEWEGQTCLSASMSRNQRPCAEACGHFLTVLTAKANPKKDFFAATAFLSFTHDGPQSLPFQITQSICSSSLSPKVTKTSCWRRSKPYCSRCLCCDLARRRISSLLLDWFRFCSTMLYVHSKTFRYFSLFI